MRPSPPAARRSGVNLVPLQPATVRPPMSDASLPHRSIFAPDTSDIKAGLGPQRRAGRGPASCSGLA
jgi:hypothetical protein